MFLLFEGLWPWSRVKKNKSVVLSVPKYFTQNCKCEPRGCRGKLRRWKPRTLKELHQFKGSSEMLPKVRKIKKENKWSESNLNNLTIARYVGYELISCKMLKWKPWSWTFSLGFSTSEADNRVFPAVQRKPHDINNNTAQSREDHPTSPGGNGCLNNHFSESGEWHLVE